MNCKQLNVRAISALIATSASLALAPVASAGLTLSTLQLGGGWEATFDAEHLGIVVVGVSLIADTLVIHKTADFTDLNEFTGAPEGLSIIFAQVGSDAETVHNIVIDSEVVENHTGVAWGAFRMELMGSAASFDAVGSAGFSVSPFTTTTFTGSDQVTFSGGGTVPDGGTWMPGVDSGALIIHVDLSSDSAVKFVLKERPIVPAPGALGLLALAAVAPRRRRDA